MNYYTMNLANGRRIDKTANGLNFCSDREYKNYMWKIRRKRQLRKRLILVAIVVSLLILTAAFSFQTMVSHAETDMKDVAFKYYTKIEVKYGDSLWSIAQEYKDSHYDSTMEYIDELVSINHLSGAGNMVKEGQTLIVPYYSGEYVR